MYKHIRTLKLSNDGTLGFVFDSHWKQTNRQSNEECINDSECANQANNEVPFVGESSAIKLNQDNQQNNRECTDGSECGNTASNNLNVVGGFEDTINQDSEQSNEDT